MKPIRKIWRAITGRREFEAGMHDELRFHIEQYAQDLEKSGVNRAEAQRRARLEFGGMNTVEEECREARGVRLADELKRELRHAFRLLRKAPGFTITALLTVAICLGANLSLFNVIDSILLRPLPFPDPSKLVTLFNTYPKAGVDRDGSSITNYYERRGQIGAFSSLSMYRSGSVTVGDPGATAREQITQVSADFFETLGRGPMMGRTFVEQETVPGADNVVILSHEYWHAHFNNAPDVIGKTLRVDGITKTVVGVLPPEFHFLSSQARLYFPFVTWPGQRAPSERHSGGNVTQLVARLRPNANVELAQAQIDAQNAALERDDPKAKMLADAGFRTFVVPLHADQVVAVRPVLVLLQAGVLLLLLIGSVNLVNLLLIRAGVRAKEMAVRRALGAGRLHIVSEALIENCVLMFGGAVCALGVSWIGTRMLIAFGADRLPLGTQIEPNSTPWMVAFLAAIGLSLLLALPVAVFNLRSGSASALQTESRTGTAGRSAQRLRQVFIVAQISLAFVLLAGAGMLALSLKNTLAVSPGFRADHVLTAQVALQGKDYPTLTAGLSFTERLVAAIKRQPGVVASGIVTNVPLSGNAGKSAATVVGYVLKPGATLRAHYSYGVDGEYFQAMGFSLLAGRFLTADDSRRTVRVCVVDQDFARYYWPNQNPLGRRLFQGGDVQSDSDAFTVVGVVGSVKQAGLADEVAQGAVYYPLAWRGDNQLFIVTRTNSAPEPMAAVLERTVRQIDASLPLTDVKTMQMRIVDSLATRRSPAMLAGLFAAIALLLTAIGAYGVLSYAVSQRRREIGVRMALGALPQQIRQEFFGLAIRLLGAGIGLGLIITWLAGRAMQPLLFHVPAVSWEMLTGVTLVLAGVCLVACLAPAKRAASVSPAQVLVE